MVLAEFKLYDGSPLLFPIVALEKSAKKNLTRKSRKARELWREAAAINETLLQD